MYSSTFSHAMLVYNYTFHCTFLGDYVHFANLFPTKIKTRTIIIVNCDFFFLVIATVYLNCNCYGCSGFDTDLVFAPFSHSVSLSTVIYCLINSLHLCLVSFYWFAYVQYVLLCIYLLNCQLFS